MAFSSTVTRRGVAQASSVKAAVPKAGGVVARPSVPAFEVRPAADATIDTGTSDPTAATCLGVSAEQILRTPHPMQAPAHSAGHVAAARRAATACKVEDYHCNVSEQRSACAESK